MEEMQDVKKRNRNKAEITEIDSAFQSLSRRFEDVELLASNKERVAMNLIRRPCRPADCRNEGRTGLPYRESVLSAIVRQQSKEEIGVAEARPSDIANEFVTFDYFCRRFPMNFIIN